MPDRSDQIALVKMRARLNRLWIIDQWIRRTQQQMQQFFRPATDERSTQQIIVVAPPEALLAEEIRHPTALKNIHHRANLDDVGRIDVANLDREAIAGQMPETKLVAVPRRPL